MKSKKRSSDASPKALADKMSHKRRSEVARRILLWVVTIFFVVVLLASELIALLPVE